MTRFRKGSRRLSALVEGDIRRLSGTRGFAETRLLTHWAEIAGADVAAICRPVKVGYGRSGVGAVLTLLTTGAQAPMLQMQLPALRERVNACYGYNAIARIAVTQTAPTGFAEGRADFTAKPRSRPAPAPETCEAATETAKDVADEGLRLALERLATNVLTRE
ncbi:MAG: DciA family protein [Pseudomonadota bacterium]